MSSAKSARGKKTPVTAEDVVTATTQLHPRARMADFDSAKVASEIEAAAEARQKEIASTCRQLLGALAEDPTLEAVAAAMNWPVAALESFLTEHKAFASRFEAARKRLTADIGDKPAATSDFDWSDANRTLLVETYVNTGDLIAAQKIVGCTPTQFNRELRQNEDFAQAVKGAEKDATNTLELLVKSEALAGNDKLMSLLMKGKGDDSPDIARLSDAQLKQQIEAIMKRARARFFGYPSEVTSLQRDTHDAINTAVGWATSRALFDAYFSHIRKGDSPEVVAATVSEATRKAVLDGFVPGKPAEKVTDAFSADGLI